MLLLPTKSEPITLLNVAVHLLQSQPTKAREAVELASMVRNQTSSDTDTHIFKLVLIAEHLTKSSPFKVGEVIELIKAVQAEKIPCEILLRLAKMLCSYGKISEAQDLLSRIDRMNSLYNTEDVNLLRALTDVAFELLRWESYDNVYKLVSKIDIKKIMSKEIISLIKLRLIFLEYILFSDSIIKKQLEEVITDQNCPSVLSALHGYSYFLQRKAEYSLEKEEEQKAIKWLSEAFLSEHRISPQKSCILNTVRWLVLNRQAAEAIDVMNQYYNENSEYRDGFTFLALFFWIIGDSSMAKKCLSVETFGSCEEPSILFARSIAVGIIGKAKSAVKILEALYRIDENFFIESKELTIWGMFSLLLKALGQEKLSLIAIKMAEKTDSLHQYRSHLYHRVPKGLHSFPIPLFVMPGEFNS